MDTHKASPRLNGCYDYLRPEKAKFMRAREDGTCVEKAPTSAQYTNAVILPLKRDKEGDLLFGMGGMTDSGGAYIESSGIEGRVFGAYPIDSAQTVHKNVVYCGYLVRHWGHFLIEAVARLWYFNAHDSDAIDNYVFFIDLGENCAIEGNYAEFLKLLGIWDKLLIINAPTRFDSVIVPELSYKRAVSYSEAYKGIFDRIRENAFRTAAHANEPSAPRLFLSRSALAQSGQTDVGGILLDEYFARNGYAVVHPEKLALSEFIGMLNRAEEIAAISGTLPHNLLFAQDCKKTVIIERNPIVNGIQCDINQIKRLQVTYVDANLFLYPVNIGFGPYILYYTDHFKLFTQDNHLLPPSEKYTSAHWQKVLYNAYMDCYVTLYGRSWFFPDWFASQISILREAYRESLPIFQRYMNGRSALRIFDRLSVLYVRRSLARWKARLLKKLPHRGA